eukprot:TRINITY_DN7874_c0_g1_i3.p1 TRINITY_DN7874_c0_g1~~TRINITY_DN7874_c0_g1_i3.p1  ORF type:complete len:545 (+),score=81.74 TRINITY_DN7874_c0_g1_i3:243-1877(+)
MNSIWAAECGTSGGDSKEVSGIAYCEGHNYNTWECASAGCCQFNEVQQTCVSSVGRGLCFKAQSVDVLNASVINASSMRELVFGQALGSARMILTNVQIAGDQYMIDENPAPNVANAQAQCGHDRESVMLGSAIGTFVSWAIVALCAALEACPHSRLARYVSLAGMEGIVAMFLGRVLGPDCSVQVQLGMTIVCWLLLLPVAGICFQPPPTAGIKKTPIYDSDVVPLLHYPRGMSAPLACVGGIFIGGLTSRLTINTAGYYMGLGSSLSTGIFVALVLAFNFDQMIDQPSGRIAIAVASLIAIPVGLAVHWMLGFVLGSVIGTIAGIVQEKKEEYEIRDANFETPHLVATKQLEIDYGDPSKHVWEDDAVRYKGQDLAITKLSLKENELGDSMLDKFRLAAEKKEDVLAQLRPDDWGTERKNTGFAIADGLSRTRQSEHSDHAGATTENDGLVAMGMPSAQLPSVKESELADRKKYTLKKSSTIPPAPPRASWSQQGGRQSGSASPGRPPALTAAASGPASARSRTPQGTAVVASVRAPGRQGG